MRRTKRRFAALAVTLLCGAAWLGCAGQEAGTLAVKAAQGESVTPGMWGGEHVRMEVTEQGATIEYACGRGSIEHKLVTEAGGRFHAKGFHVREHGGPEGGGEAKGAPALYSGRTDGKTMTLTVKLAETDEEVGSYTLTHGKKVRLTKCM